VAGCGGGAVGAAAWFGHVVVVVFELGDALAAPANALLVYWVLPVGPSVLLIDGTARMDVSGSH
jgi:hypothetical protein